MNETPKYEKKFDFCFFPSYLTFQVCDLDLWPKVTIFDVDQTTDKRHFIANKKHSENADTSMSVPFDLDV